MIRFLQTPGKTKKFFLSALLVVICVAMVWYLVPQGNSAIESHTGVLARVGDQQVNVSDVDRVARQYAQGRQLPPGFMRQVADALISQQAEIAEAHRLGLSVNDAEVRDYLQHGPFMPYFFPDGKFIGQEKYTQFVAQNMDETVEKFEQGIKAELLTRKLESLIDGAITVSPEDVKQAFEQQGTKVKLQYAVLSAEDIAKQIKPTDAELKAYYESHKAAYANSIPEKRTARYVVIDISNLQNSIKISPEELQAYYNQHREEFRQPEQVKASHILIKTPPPGPDGKVDPKAEAAARAQAEKILKELKAGASFEELAKKNSDDKASAINGGSLGWFQRGAMVPEFEKAAFSLPKGQISGLVKSQFGYHIIRVDDKREAGVQPLDAVKEQIEPILVHQKAQQEADNLANKIESEARTQGLEAAAAKNGLEVVNPSWFARADSLPGVGQSPEFMDAMFNAKEKSQPQEIRTAAGYVIFQVTGVKPPATPTFAEIRDQGMQDFKNERARVLLFEKSQELSDRAHAVHDLAKVAKEVGATVKTSDLVGPQGQVPDIGSMSGPASVAFKMKPGEISGPIPAGRNAAVFTVTDRQSPSAADMEKSKEQIREALLRRNRQEVLALYVDNLRQQMEKNGNIKVNKDEMDSLTRRGALGG